MLHPAQPATAATITVVPVPRPRSQLWSSLVADHDIDQFRTKANGIATSFAAWAAR